MKDERAHLELMGGPMRFRPITHHGTLPRILLAEDDTDARELIAAVLRRIAHVDEARDGEHALELALESPPDLVLTDIVMPRLDGLELTQLLGHDERLRRVPVIMLTAKDSPRDVVVGINCGARHYLTKPFTPEQLVRKVRRALRRPRRLRP